MGQLSVETTTCSIVRSVVIMLFGAVLTILVLIIARRYRRPVWLLPAFVGAMLSGVSIAALLSVMGLVNIVQSIRVSGATGLAAVAQGLWDANQTWRIGLYVSLIAAVVLASKYFLHPRAQAAMGESWAPRTALVFLFSVVSFVGTAISWVSFHSLNRALIAAGQSGLVQPGSTVALVSSRAWIIAIAAITAVAFCILSIPLSLAFRKPGVTSPEAHRVAGAFLTMVGFFVLFLLITLIAFSRSMTAMAAMPAGG